MTNYPDEPIHAVFYPTDVPDNGDPSDAHWGVCPKCLRKSGCFSIGPNHWFVCDEHKFKWNVGQNLFSCWRDLGPAVWLSNFERIKDYKCLAGMADALDEAKHFRGERTGGLFQHFIDLHAADYDLNKGIPAQLVWPLLLHGAK